MRATANPGLPTLSTLRAQPIGPLRALGGLEGSANINGVLVGPGQGPGGGDSGQSPHAGTKFQGVAWAYTWAPPPRTSNPDARPQPAMGAPQSGRPAGVRPGGRREATPAPPGPSPRTLLPPLRSARLPPAAAGWTLQPGHSPPSHRAPPISGLAAPEVSGPSAFRHWIGWAPGLRPRPFPRVL